MDFNLRLLLKETEKTSPDGSPVYRLRSKRATKNVFTVIAKGRYTLKELRDLWIVEGTFKTEEKANIQLKKWGKVNFESAIIN